MLHFQRRISAHPHRPRGFALFEVMAALLVLSVSFLGTALLLAKTAREGRSAIFLGRAASLASEMAERMRVSPGAKQSYSLNAGSTYVQAAETAVAASPCGGLYTVPGTAPTTLGDCNTPQDAARYDLSAWQQQLRGGLPGGAGFVLPPTPSRSTHVIAVAWVEPVTQVDQAGASLAVNQKCSNVVGVDLAAPANVRCYAMEIQL